MLFREQCPLQGNFQKDVFLPQDAVHAIDKCHTEKPPITIFNDDHKAKFFLYEEKYYEYI